MEKQQPDIPITPGQKYLQELRSRGLYSVDDPEGVNWLMQHSGLYNYVITIPGNSTNLENVDPDLVFPKDPNMTHMEICSFQEEAYNAANPLSEKPYVVGVGKSVVELGVNLVYVRVLDPVSLSTAQPFIRRGQQKYYDALDIDKVKAVATTAWNKLKQHAPKVNLRVK